MWDAETNWRRAARTSHLGFETAHFLDGFAWPDKKFHFKPDWAAFGGRAARRCRCLPDHFDVIDNATADKPFRLVAAPARTFLNSTFTETPSSPEARGAADGDDASRGLRGAGRRRGRPRRARQRARQDDRARASREAGQQKGVVVVEGIWPNRNFETGIGINAVTSADPGWPNGGAVFHDTAVWIRKPLIGNHLPAR